MKKYCLIKGFKSRVQKLVISLFSYEDYFSYEDLKTYTIDSVIGWITLYLLILLSPVPTYVIW